MNRQTLEPAFRQALQRSPEPIRAGMPRVGFALLCDRLLNGGVPISVANDTDAELARAAELVGFIADPDCMNRLTSVNRNWTIVLTAITGASDCLGKDAAAAIVAGWHESDPSAPPLLRKLPLPRFSASGDS